MTRLGDVDGGELCHEGALLFAHCSITWSCPLSSTHHSKFSEEGRKGRKDGQAQRG